MSVSSSLYINYLKRQMESLEARENFGLENVSTETLIKMKNSFDAFLEISGKIKEPSDRSVRLRGCIMHSPVSEKENEVMLLQEKQALLNANHVSERLRIVRSIEEQMQEPISATDEGFVMDEGLKEVFLRVGGLFNIISSYMGHPAALSALVHVVHPGFYSGNELIRSQKSGVMDYLILEPLATDLEKSSAVQKLTNQLREISIIEKLKNRESPLENFKIIESRNIIRLFSILEEICTLKFNEEFKASLETIDLESDLKGAFFNILYHPNQLSDDLDPYSDTILIADQINEWMKREENSKFLDGITELDIRSDVGPSFSVMTGTGITLLPRCIGLLKNLKRLSFCAIGMVYGKYPDDESREVSRSLKLLPNSIGKLINLESIELIGVGLLGLPFSIGEMRKLTKITIENDKLLFLPSSMGNLTDLQYLELSCHDGEEVDGEDFTVLYNQNSSYFPSSLQLLQKLKLFRFEHFHLSHFPTFIGELTGLERLCLKRNKFAEFPESLRNLKRLKEYRRKPRQKFIFSWELNKFRRA
ncbi:MAG: leucine-rich repeat domain-containing protein [Chlamydiota bacterium]